MNNNPNNTAPLRVSDARKACQQIAEFALSPAEYSSLRDDEVYRVETHIAALIAQYKPVFGRLEPQLQSTVYNVLASIRDEAMVRRARTDCNAFMEYVFADDVSGEPVQQADIHRRWQHIMSTQKQSLLIGPRSHGKSTQVVGHAIWRLGNNPNLRIKVVSNTDNESSKRILEMQMHIEKNPRYKRVFPHIHAADRGAWNTDRFYVARNRVMREPSVEGYGVLSSGVGGRCDLLVLDDVVDAKNALTQPGLRTSVKQAVKNAWLPLLADDGVVINICTLWHKDDLNCDLGGDTLKAWVKHADGRGSIPDQSKLEDGEWYVCFDAIDENFKPVWPEKWPVEKLKAKRRTIGRSAFDRGFRNRVVDDEKTVVDSNWIHYYQRGTLPDRKELIVVQSYDLATGKKGKNISRSRFTCVTLAAHFTRESQRIYVLDAFRRNAPFPEQTKIVKAGYKAITPTVILLESNAYQVALYQQLLDTTLLPLIPVYSKISKEARLDSVTPLMEAGHVLFSERLDPERHPVLATKGDLVGELLDFPFAAFDDLVDAFSQGIRYLQEYSTTLQMYGDNDFGGEANVYMLDGELDPHHIDKEFSDEMAEDSAEMQTFDT